MKVKLLTKMGKMQAGEFFYPRSEAQMDALVEKGTAEQVEDDPIVEKKLVLKNPEPGTYTTAWVTAKHSATEETEQNSSTLKKKKST